MLTGTDATDVASFPLEAGKYVVSAKAWFTNPSGDKVTCNLVASGGAPDDSDTIEVSVAGGASAPAALLVAHDFGEEGGTVTLSCSNGAGTSDTDVKNVKVIAILVGNLTDLTP